MRGKTTSMVERPLSQQYCHHQYKEFRGKNSKNSVQQIQSEMSLVNSPTTIAKMGFNEKLERYKLLLEKVK